MKHLLILILLFYSLNIFSQTPKPPKVQFDFQGHRGARALLPENTIPSFLLAIDKGVNTLEMDIVVSKDMQIVVSHDPFFAYYFCLQPDGSPITEEEQESFNIYEMDYEEVKKFDVGSKGNPRFLTQKPLKTYKPLLSEVIESANNYCKANNRPPVKFNIEIKSRKEWYDKFQPQPDTYVSRIIDTLEKFDIWGRVTLQSFDVKILEEIHRQKPEVEVAFLVENIKGFKKNMKRLSFTPPIYSPYFKLITPKTVKKVHKKGMRLVPWTVNEWEDMEKLIKMGVDGIITDFPNLKPKVDALLEKL